MRNKPFKHGFLTLLGWTSLALGIIGAFLPVMPTTPFVLVSAWCFSQTNPRIHAWILANKTLGPPIRDWNTRRVIRPRAKAVALTLMSCSLAFSLYRIPAERLALKVMLIVFIAGSATFIVTQKSR